MVTLGLKVAIITTNEHLLVSGGRIHVLNIKTNINFIVEINNDIIDLLAVVAILMSSKYFYITNSYRLQVS